MIHKILLVTLFMTTAANADDETRPSLSLLWKARGIQAQQFVEDSKSKSKGSKDPEDLQIFECRRNLEFAYAMHANPKLGGKLNWTDKLDSINFALQLSEDGKNFTQVVFKYGKSDQLCGVTSVSNVTTGWQIMNAIGSEPQLWILTKKCFYMFDYSDPLKGSVMGDGKKKKSESKTDSNKADES